MISHLLSSKVSRTGSECLPRWNWACCPVWNFHSRAPWRPQTCRWFLSWEKEIEARTFDYHRETVYSCEKLPDYCVIAVETVVGLSEDALLHLLLLRRCHLLVLGNDQVSIGTACLNCFGSVMEGLVQAILQFCFRSGFFQLFKLSNWSHRRTTIDN